MMGVFVEKDHVGGDLGLFANLARDDCMGVDGARAIETRNAGIRTVVKLRHCGGIRDDIDGQPIVVAKPGILHVARRSNRLVESFEFLREGTKGLGIFIRIDHEMIARRAVPSC